MSFNTRNYFIESSNQHKLWPAVVLALTAYVLTVHAEVIGDPFQSYLANHKKHEPRDSVLSIKCDIDGDGHDDYLLAYKSSRQEDNEYIWTAFIAREGGFVEVKRWNSRGELDETSLYFNSKRCFLGIVPELKKWGLITLLIGERGSSKMVAYSIVDNILESKEIGTYDPDELSAILARFSSNGLAETKGLSIREFPIP